MVQQGSFWAQMGTCTPVFTVPAGNQQQQPPQSIQLETCGSGPQLQVELLEVLLLVELLEVPLFELLAVLLLEPLLVVLDADVLDPLDADPPSSFDVVSLLLQAARPTVDEAPMTTMTWKSRSICMDEPLPPTGSFCVSLLESKEFTEGKRVRSPRTRAEYWNRHAHTRALFFSPHRAAFRPAAPRLRGYNNSSERNTSPALETPAKSNASGPVAAPWRRRLPRASTSARMQTAQMGSSRMTLGLRRRSRTVPRRIHARLGAPRHPRACRPPEGAGTKARRGSIGPRDARRDFATVTPCPKKNVAASVRDLLMQLSRTRQENFNFVLDRYARERLLYGCRSRITRRRSWCSTGVALRRRGRFANGKSRTRG